MTKSGLEYVVVATGPSNRIDSQRAKAGSKIYSEEGGRKVIISGQMDFEGEWTPGKYPSTQSGRIYKILRKSGVPRKEISVEGRSANTRENVYFSYELVREENPKGFILPMDKYHGARFKTIAWFEKFYGRMQKNFRVDIAPEGIERA